MPSIRLLSICVFRHGTKILVGRGFDDVKREFFVRPVGGAIDFGETAEAALRRELREELGVEIVDARRLGVLENFFTYRGEPGHEVVFVFDASFAESRLYEQSEIPLHEAIWDGAARWLDLSGPLTEPLYPDGLLDLLRSA